MRYKAKHNLEEGQSGEVQLIIDNVDDLWALYNIIAIGDNIRLSTFRKVQHETGSKTSCTKKKIFITINIEQIDYSPNAIRVKGKNISENEYIAIGQYQTDEIGVNSSFTLFKNYWDNFHLETLKKATDITVTSEIAAILMDSEIAHLFYISSTSTINKGEITQSMPKKRAGSTKYNKCKDKFFEKILEKFINQINFENTKVLIIASPGNTKDDFKKYMKEQIENKSKEWSELKNNLNKIIYTHSSSGFKHSLVEILAKPEINKLIKDTKCVDDVIIMEKFNEMLGTKADKLFFGYKAFEIAYEKNAIKTLIITDGYLRAIPPLTRKDLSAKIKDLKLDTNVTVSQFSSKHVTGEKIDEFGGICGILKYVVEEISEIGQEDNDKKEEEEKINDSSKNTKPSIKEGKKENKKEDKKEEKGKNKTKKTNTANNANKNISQPKINFKRKKNTFEDDEDYEDYEDDYDDYDKPEKPDKPDKQTKKAQEAALAEQDRLRQEAIARDLQMREAKMHAREDKAPVREENTYNDYLEKTASKSEQADVDIAKHVASIIAQRTSKLATPDQVEGLVKENISPTPAKVKDKKKAFDEDDLFLMDVDDL